MGNTNHMITTIAVIRSCGMPNCVMQAITPSNEERFNMKDKYRKNTPVAPVSNRFDNASKIMLRTEQKTTAENTIRDKPMDRAGIITRVRIIANSAFKIIAQTFRTATAFVIKSLSF